MRARTTRPALFSAMALAVAALTLHGMPALAYIADATLVDAAGDTIAVSCQTPNPVGAEESPTISSQGVTVPPVVTPPIDVPPATVGQVQVGPVSVGPISAGGFTVPSQTLGGGTYGEEQQADHVAGVGASACLAVDTTNLDVVPGVTGVLRLVVELEELNPATDQLAFVTWSEADTTLLDFNIRSQTGCVDCPSLPQVSGNVAAGWETDLQIGVPGAGQLDPRSGNLSMGVAQVYVGVPLVVQGKTQPTGVGCAAGDFSCSSSGVFPVY